MLVEVQAVNVYKNIDQGAGWKVVSAGPALINPVVVECITDKECGSYRIIHLRGGRTVLTSETVDELRERLHTKPTSIRALMEWALAEDMK